MPRSIVAEVRSRAAERMSHAAVTRPLDRGGSAGGPVGGTGVEDGGIDQRQPKPAHQKGEEEAECLERQEPGSPHGG